MWKICAFLAIWCCSHAPYASFCPAECDTVSQAVTGQYSNTLISEINFIYINSYIA